MWIKAYHNPDGKEEFDNEPLISTQKKGICEFMNSTYRNHFWTYLKDYSNFPHPEACPVKAVKFFTKFTKFVKYITLFNSRNIMLSKIFHSMAISINLWPDLECGELIFL